MSRIGKSTEVEIRLVFARGWEEGEMGKDCLIALGLMERNIVNALNATE